MLKIFVCMPVAYFCMFWQLENVRRSEGWMYLTIALLGIVVIYFRSWLRCVQLAFTLPGPAALPVIGNALMILDSKSKQIMYTKYFITSSLLLFNYLFSRLQRVKYFIKKYYSPNPQKT